MAKNYNDYKYFENRPDVVKIFEDLEAFLDWCKLEGAVFDEANLYNRESWQWRNFEKSRKAKRTGFVERKPYHGKKQYGERFSN